MTQRAERGTVRRRLGVGQTVTSDERYQELRKAVEQYFTPRNRLDEPLQRHRSPSGAYELEISSYSTQPGAWEFTRGIARSTSDQSVIADVKRNFSDFWHAWVPHPNGHEYLLCGEDYQGYSVINLGTGVHHRYFADEAHNGMGFCWAEAYPSPDGTIVAVEGCYWACPYELVFFDFSDPERLPLPEIERISDLYACKGWQEDGAFVFQCSYQVRARDGAKLDELPADELNILLKQKEGIEGRREVRAWRRP